ncbi:MAG: prolipoprotein diacylglyceryl transferase family protein [Ktedonobacterales bacterium]
MRTGDSFAGKALYGVLFVVIIPSIVIYWASILDETIDWPVVKLPILAVCVVIGGMLMILKGMLDLMYWGQGLPMNAYPPKQLVTRGIYSLFSHPIYLGAVLLSTGIALWFRSSSGLYIVTPIIVCMILSLLYGYERLAMEKRFGSAMSQYRPLFSLPASAEEKATWRKKIVVLVLIFLPWGVVGYFVDNARCSQDCNGAFSWLLHAQPPQNWASLVWFLPAIYIVGWLLLARTDRRVRYIAIAGASAAALSMYVYIVVSGYGLHVLDNPWALTLVNTAILILAVNYHFVWSTLQNVSERIANSRHDWLLAGGRFRIMNHSIYSGLAGAVGVGIASYVVGNPFAVLIMAFCALTGAAVYAQVSWGSTALLRPFGYWGAILGGIAGAFLVHTFFGIPLTQLCLAGVLSAPFAQAIGRLRCLVQGCCHGTVTSKALGIRVWQSQSRVVTNSGLKGEYILNTQLYSILFNVPLGLLLLSMWLSHSFQSTFIIGLYFILTGIERFTEDAYRGERQTKSIGALRENQWIALVSVLMGIIISVLPSPLPESHTSVFGLSFFATAITVGLLTAFAMSMDFPKSAVPFSRLSG